jgi:hypothetical protein
MLSFRHGLEKYMDVSTEVHCGVCGSANYSLPSGSEPQSTIICNDCGREMGTFANLVDELVAQVKAHSAEGLKRDLDRLGDSQPSARG